MRKFAVLLTVLMILPAVATVFRSGRDVTISPDQVINDDLVISGNSVNMRGHVNGDVVAAGGNVLIAGPVRGDLIVTGGNVTLTEPVTGSLYVASGNVKLNAPVRRNVVAAGGTIDANGPIGRDLTVAGGTVNVRSSIGRDLRGSIGTLTVLGGAVIGGSIIAQAGSHDIAPGAVVMGQQQITRPQGRAGHLGVLGWFLSRIFSGIMLLIGGLLFLALGPRLTEQSVTTLRAQPGASVLAGLIIFLIALPLFLLLFVTLVGIPIALAWAALYTLSLYISPIFPVMIIAGLLSKSARENPYIALLIGVGLLVLVRFIPVLGGLVTFAAILFGLGALTLALYERMRPERPAPVVQAQIPPEAPPQQQAA